MAIVSFHLCQEGRRLYLLSSEALDAKAPEGKRMNREYLQHRVDCPECTKPLDMAAYLAEINKEE